MSEILLSIIIPVYNTAYYLRKCLNSILLQPKDCLEVILVDDGSTDGSGEICDEYAYSIPVITVVHQHNAGVSAARNAGIGRSRGKYLWFCDSDDRILPGSLSTILTCIRRNDPELITFPVIQEDDSQNQLGLIPVAEGDCYGSRGPLQSGDPLYPYAHVMRRDLVGKERFDTSLSLLEDRDFLYRVCSKVRGNACIVDSPLYAYFITREDSAVNSLSVGKYIAANDVHWRILEGELTHNRTEPAYAIATSHTLSVLALIARTGKCLESFEVLREKLLLYDRYSKDLRGLVAAKYAICRYMPGLFKAAYYVEGKLRRKDAGLGSTVLISSKNGAGDVYK